MPSAINPDSPDALQTLRTAPLTFGAWGDLKRLYKELEAETDPSLAHQNALAALIARLDAAPLVRSHVTPVAQINKEGGYGGLTAGALRNGRGLFLLNNRGSRLQTADFNVPDRLKPRLGMPLNTAQAGWTAVVWAGPTLAALVSGNQVQVVDVSEFYAPRLRGVVGGKSGGTTDNALANLKHIAGGDDGLVYAASVRVGGDFFHVISLVDPDAPRIVGSLPIPGASRVCVVPGTSLVAVLGSGPLPESLLSSLLSRVGLQTQKSETRHLHLVDVARPDRPVLVSTFAVKHEDVLAADRSFVYVGDKEDPTNRYGRDHGLNIISIENPAAPRLVRRVAINTYYPILSITCYEKFVYAAASYEGLRVIDVEKSTGEPKLLRQVPYVTNLVRDGDTMYGVTYRGPFLLHLGDNGAASPSVYGTPPSPETLAYMKRRARRYLHQIAKTNPSIYPAMAARFLSEPGSQTFAPAYQWIAADLLFGGGGRYTQASHGRGIYKETRPRGLSIRRREERFPGVWDAHPGEAATLFSAPDAIWPAREMALRILRIAKQPVPRLDSQTLEKLLDTPSLLLIAEAVKQAAALAEAGEKMEPATASAAVAKASAKLRRRLLQSLVPVAVNDAAWVNSFAEALMTRLPPADAVVGASRRAVALAALFAAFFPDQLSEAVVVRLAPLLLSTKRPETYAPILQAARREGAGNLFNWVRILSLVSDEPARDALLSALMESVQNKPLDERFYELILLSPAQSRWIWPLVRASQIQTETLRRIWASLLADPAYENMLRLAMASPDALALLGQAGISDSEMAGYLEVRPEIVDLLTPDAFARLTQTLSPSLTLRLAAAASDSVWANLRQGWLRNLREGIGLRELWTSAEAALKSDATGNLETRLLQDADVSATFLNVDDVAAVLEIREPSFAPLLGAYFARHRERIMANDALFLLAATHPLPEVRSPVLSLLPARTIRLPFALGLLESEVPASVLAGRAWFDNADDVPLLDRALALCDSPAASVRQIGREFAEQNRDALPLPEFSAALTEHADPQMQAFVARLLGNEPAPQFDREILRTRYQSRQAKEVVKTRQENQKNGGSVDVETLLALARGSSTPRDAEWALTQLVRRALAGETIEGLVVEGGAVN